MYNSNFLNSFLKSSKGDSMSNIQNDFQGTFSSPKLTSTPLPVDLNRDSPLTSTRVNNHLNVNLKSRYSLSDVSYKTHSPKHNSLNGSPLISSPSYANKSNNITSTYIDARSPGLASRIVQYDEKNKSFRTHQTKYGRPGAFPVVHLFKKDVPIIKPKQSRVTIKFASSDLAKYNSPEHNRMLLQQIVYSGTDNTPNLRNNGDTSTRSVLDALKEISRKRIHTSDEKYGSGNENTNTNVVETVSPSSMDNNKKRRRAEMSPEWSSDKQISNKQISKKPYAMSEILASKSSTDYSEREKNKRSMRFSPTNEISSKQKKLINVETQTVVPEVKNIGTEPVNMEKPIAEDNKKNDKKDEVIEKSPVIRRPLKIFDDRPLEMIRKNRLNTLIAAISSKTDNDSNIPQRSLHSILSTPVKAQYNKHVTFSLPDSSSNDTTISVSNAETPKLNFGVTQTSTALHTPVISPVVSDTSQAKEVSTSPTSVSSTEIKEKENSPSIITQSATSISFGSESSSFPLNKSAVNSTSTANLSGSGLQTSNNTSTSATLITNDAVVKITIPSFSFGNLSQTPSVSNQSNIELPRSAGNSGEGKVKFDLSKPVAPPVINSPSTSSESQPQVTTSTNVMFNFGSSQTKTTSISIPSTFASKRPEITVTKTTIPSYSFGSSNNIPTNINSAGFSLPSFNNTTTSGSFKNSSLFTSNTIGTTPVTSNIAFNFGDSTKDSNVINTVIPTTLNSTIKFGSPSVSSFKSDPVPVLTTTSGISSNLNISIPKQTTNAPTFSITSTTCSANTGGVMNLVPSFNVTTASSSLLSFGSTTTTSSNVGTAVTAVTNIFGSNTASVPISLKSTINSPNPNSASIGNTFTTPIPALNTFNVTTTSTGNLFSNTAPTTSTNSLFGTGAISSSTPAFNTNTNTGFTLNKSAPFGVNSSSSCLENKPNSLFTFVAAKTTSETSIPAFGSIVTSTPSLSSASLPTFENSTFSTSAKTNTSTSSSTTTTNMPIFGSNTVPNFGSSFGASSGFNNQSATSHNISTTTHTPTFGAYGSTNNSPPFGNVTTTTSTLISTPSFSFGNNNQSSTFNTKPLFGATAAPTFGPPSSSVFGAITSTSTFGSNTTTPAFGTTSNMFGANTTNNNIFNSSFGSTTTTASSAFGSNTTPSFGSSTTFGSNSSGFGSATATSNIFPINNSFGTSVTTANNNFGNTNATFGNNTNNTFGTATPFATSSAAPAFGNTFTQQPSTGFGTNFPNNSSFESKPQTSNFGANASSSFGNAASAFGQSANNFKPGNTQNGVFTFGSTTKPTNTFSFDETGAQKTAFQFGASQSTTPAFGTVNTTPAFGSLNSAPAFGSGLTPQFNSQGATFSIGAGSTSGRLRMQLRAKRRT